MSITVPPDFRHGFLWRNNAMTDLGPFAVDLVDIPGPKINNSDQVIGLARARAGMLPSQCNSSNAEASLITGVAKSTRFTPAQPCVSMGAPRQHLRWHSTQQE